MSKYHSFTVGELTMTEHISDYNSEEVEHLVDQLIKLQQEYLRTSQISGKSQTENAMKTINKALERALEAKGGNNQ